MIELVPSGANARPRVPAGVPLDSLLVRCEELTRRWAATLLLGGSLESMRTLALDELASSGPAVCGMLLRALVSDAELDLLTGAPGARGGESREPMRRLGSICCARDPAALARAMEVLRGVLWQVLRADASEQRPDLLAELADRLAHVCAVALSVALDGQAPRSRGERLAEPGLLELATAGASGFVAHDTRAVAPAEGGPAVIVDERAQGATADIAVRDRRGEGPGAWVGAISARLERYALEREPFAVLLVELADGARLGRDPAQLERASGRLEDALSVALEPGPGELTRERAGRFWVLAGARDRAGAESLEQHVRTCAEACSRMELQPLNVLVGSALCPDDGTHAAALAAHADLGLYADRAARAWRRSPGERPS